MKKENNVIEIDFKNKKKKADFHSAFAKLQKMNLKGFQKFDFATPTFEQ